MNSVDNSWSLASLMEPWLSKEALEQCPSLDIKGVNLDSRLVVSGDLYLAVAGASTHGMRYAVAAVEAGALAVVLSESDSDEHAVIVAQLRKRQVPVLMIDRLQIPVNDIAARFYREPDSALTLIAVTGTDGKTSVCRFVAQALQATNLACGYIGTLGWGMGEVLEDTALTTPDGVTLRRMLATMRDQGARCVALEASSHGIAEGRLDNLSIDVAVLTNLGRDHLDYHVTLQAYRAAKEQLFYWNGLRVAVLNADDAMGHDLLTQLEHVDCIGFSAHESAQLNDAQTIRACNVQAHDSGVSFELVDRDNAFSVNSTLLGSFNVDNLLACYACLKACGVAANDAQNAIATVTPVAGRMERLGGGGKPTIVIDYCHTPGALKVAIDASRAHCASVLWIVFGCGGDRDKGKRAPMAKAAEAADRIVLTDDNPRTESSAAIIADVMEGFDSPDSVVVICDRREAIRHAVAHSSAGDLVLVAGKGHENYQIIGATKKHFSDREASLAALECAS